ncbi:hypothetical protein BGZ60DRAFT_435219 [Tricladium varicosporioides]|nr:hypothetical protein BGZ60DRAFT_435219 [Hymenoscyphus varicosporioides]
MRLREKTRAPGRYREEDDDQNWNDPKPIFVCPTITFDPNLPAAAFPTIPLGEYPPPRPTETPASNMYTVSGSGQKEGQGGTAQLLQRIPINNLNLRQCLERAPRWEAVGEPGEFSFSLVGDDELDQDAMQLQNAQRLPYALGHRNNNTEKVEEEYPGWFPKRIPQPDGTAEDRYFTLTSGTLYDWSFISDGLKLVIVRELLRIMPLRKVSDFLQWNYDDDAYFVNLYNKGASSTQREEDIITHFNQQQTRLIMSGKVNFQKDWDTLVRREFQALKGRVSTFIISQREMRVAIRFLAALKYREEFSEDWKDREDIPTTAEIGIISQRIFRYVGLETSFSTLNFRHEDMFDELDALNHSPAEVDGDEDTTNDGGDIPAEVPRWASSGWTRPPPLCHAAPSPRTAERQDNSRRAVRHIKPYRQPGRPRKVVMLTGMQPSALRRVLNVDDAEKTMIPIQNSSQCPAAVNAGEPKTTICNIEKNIASQFSNTTIEKPPAAKRVPKLSQKASENGGLLGQPRSQKIPLSGSIQEVTPPRRVNIRLIVTPTKHTDQLQKILHSKSTLDSKVTKSNNDMLESFSKPPISGFREPSKENKNYSGTSDILPRGNTQYLKPALGLPPVAPRSQGNTRFRRPQDIPGDPAVVTPPYTAAIPGSQTVQDPASTSPTRSILDIVMKSDLTTKERAALPSMASLYSKSLIFSGKNSQNMQPKPSLLPSLYAPLPDGPLDTSYVENTGNAPTTEEQPQTTQPQQYHNSIRDFTPALTRTNRDSKEIPTPEQQSAHRDQSDHLHFSPVKVTRNGFSASLDASTTQKQEVVGKHSSSSDHRASGTAISQSFASMAPPFSMVSNLPQHSIPKHSKLPDPFFTQSPIFPYPGVSRVPHPGTFVNRSLSDAPLDTLAQSQMSIAQVGGADTLQSQATTPINPSLYQQSTEVSNDLIDPALLPSDPFNAEQHLIEQQHESSGTSTPIECMIFNLPPRTVSIRHTEFMISKQPTIHQPASMQPTVSNFGITRSITNIGNKADRLLQAPKPGLNVSQGKEQILDPLEVKEIPQIQPVLSQGSATQLSTTKSPSESVGGGSSISRALDAYVSAGFSTDIVRFPPTKGKEPDINSNKATIDGGELRKMNPMIPAARLNDLLRASQAKASSQNSSLNTGITKAIAMAKDVTTETLELPPLASSSQPGASQSIEQQIENGNLGMNGTNKRAVVSPDPLLSAAKPPPKKLKTNSATKPAQLKNAAAAKPSTKAGGSTPEISHLNNPFSGTTVVPLACKNGNSAAGIESVTMHDQIKTPSRAPPMNNTHVSRLSPEAAFFTPPENRSPQCSPLKSAFYLDRVTTNGESPTQKPKGKRPLIPTIVDGGGPPITLPPKKNGNRKAQPSVVMQASPGAVSPAKASAPGTEFSDEVIEEYDVIKSLPITKPIKAPKHVATRKLPVHKPKEKKNLITKTDTPRPAGPSLLEQIEVQEAAQNAEDAAQKILGAPPPILEQRSRSAAKTAKNTRGNAPASPAKGESKKKATAGSIDGLATSQDGVTNSSCRLSVRSGDSMMNVGRRPSTMSEMGTINGTTPQVIIRKRGSTSLLGSPTKPAKRHRNITISSSNSVEAKHKQTRKKFSQR